MLITPEYVFKDVTHITPEFLAGKGIRALVLDIDNTLTADRSQELPDEVAGWLAQMKEAGIGYGAINHPIDRDPVCGYTGIIGEVCPRCGRREGEGVPLSKLQKLGLYKNYNSTTIGYHGDPAEEADRQPNTLKIVKK